MKRPYNLFHRANLEMRTRDVERSFGNAITWNKSISEHASKIATSLLLFPFSADGQGHAVTGCNTLDLSELPSQVELVYLDPPYLNGTGTGVDSFAIFLNTGLARR